MDHAHPDRVGTSAVQGYVFQGMVSPPEPEGPGPRRPTRWAVIGALGVIVAAAVGIGRLTTPEAATSSTTLPLDVPTTPTTAPPFHVSQIEQGEPIEWARAITFEDQRVLSVEYRGGTFYLFTTFPNTYPEFEDRGLRVWTSSDGLTWVTTGTLGPEFQPSGVTSNGSGFVAYGIEQGGTPLVWTSQDGSAWHRVELPGEHVAGTSVWFQTAHANNDLTLLVAEEYIDATQAMLDRKVDGSFPGLRAHLEQPSADPEGWTVELSGPLWIPLRSLSLDEIGLTPGEVEGARASDSLLLVAWVGSPDGRTWDRVELADTWEPGDAQFSYLDAPIDGPDGRIWARGYGPGDRRTFATVDGIDWERLDPRLPNSEIVTWGDAYVSVGHTRAVPTLRVSPDLDTWESLETDRFLPSGHSWGANHLPTIAGGGAGVAMTVRSHRTREVTTEPIRLERDGYTLEVGRQTRLLRGNEVVVSNASWWDNRPRHTRLSDDVAAVVFSNPETGEDLVSFMLDELRAVEEATSTNYMPPEVVHDHHVIIFSPDGRDWTVQDLAGIVGGHEWVRLVIGDERIALITETDWTRGAAVWIGVPPD